MITPIISLISRRVEPWQTMGISGDQPVKLLIQTKEGDRYEIYRDNENTLVFSKTYNINAVFVEEIGTFNDVLGGDNNLHKLIVKVNGEKICEIPARLYGENIVEFRFVDENGNELVGDISAVNFDDRTVFNYYGSSIAVPANTKTYIEFATTRNGKKYYVIINVSEYEPGSYVVRLTPHDKYYVSLKFRFNYEDIPLPKAISSLVHYSVKITGLTLEIAKRTIFAAPMWFARWLSERLGIGLPIVDVRINDYNEYFEIEIVYEQDEYQLILEALVVAMIILAVGIAAYLIDIDVKEKYEVKKEAYHWSEELTRAYNKVFTACIDSCGNDKECIEECSKEAKNVIQSIAGNTSKVIVAASKEISDKDKEIEKYKTAAMVAGGLALVAILTKR